MDPQRIRNIAIIAHVDHGKTTMVDELFKQSGMFRDNQRVDERMMDSMDLERERGITISAKNGSFKYKEYHVNIIDTPGHADFGGQVERVLRMADAALLLVDAAEGPMPQTYFVLKKALALSLPVILVINKIDKPAARCDWAIDQVFDLFVQLNAPEELLDFPIVYASAKEGYATNDPKVRTDNMEAIYEMIVDKVPAPAGDIDGPVQILISTIDHSPFLGRLGIGKITSGKAYTNQPVLLCKRNGDRIPSRITKVYRFEGDAQVESPEAVVGEIVAVAGMEFLSVGETITDRETPIPLEPIQIDPPTISMNFVPNDSPFAGREGDYVTSRHLHDRLQKELLSDVALEVENLTEITGYKVSGRGELHLSILIEKMRREGFEFQVTRPQVIQKMVDGKRHEPFERLTVDVGEEYSGKVIEALGYRRGQMLEMTQGEGLVRLIYRIPTRGLLGYRSEFMSDTRGMGLMGYVFEDYGPYAGEIKNRANGALVISETGVTAGYALFSLQDRGSLFLGPGVNVYEGMLCGENSRDSDLTVNPNKSKKHSNVRSSGTDEALTLITPRIMSLEDCIAFINDDELVEVTPTSIRLRKRHLKEVDRKRQSSKKQPLN